MYWKATLLFMYVFMHSSLHATPEGLVAYWPFDEGSGITTLDQSGNGNDGDLMGDTHWVSGQLVGALEFNGSNSAVIAPDIAFDNRSFTVAMWISANLPAIIQFEFPRLISFTRCGSGTPTK